MMNNFSQFSTYPNGFTYDRYTANNAQLQGNMNNQNYAPNQGIFTPQTNITFVNGVEGAKAYQLSPNSSVLLMDSDNSKFYVKSTDSLGVAKLSCYTFTEEDLNKPAPDSTADSGETTKQILDVLEGLNSKISELEKFQSDVTAKLGDLLS